MTNIDYNNLPQKVGELWEDIKAIKEILNKDKVTSCIPQKLTFTKALVFLAERGYVMSKSKLYKLTALNEIPCMRFGNRLIFDSKELLDYCKASTKGKNNLEIETIVKSARNQLNTIVK